ncbi:DUF3450 family protein [Litorimonas sp. RW-G-Af-16]|uniref:DUF3450 family protein n=1 Tax=Litorimonas sp. RW-G-Af-16 TaxID=3241168 RepID=UPI00390CBFDA
MVSSNIARKVLCAGAALLMSASALGITASAQDADAEAKSYAALLQQISDLKISIAQKEAYLSNQKGQIDSLQGQIEALPAKKEAIRPIVAAMTAEIEKELVKDVPFRRQERFNRLDKLKEDLADESIGESVLFRQAMNLYDAEVNYGNSVGAYAGDNPVTPGTRFAACEANQASSTCALTDDLRGALDSGATLDDLRDSLNDGNYIHFGRLSLAYLELDSSVGYQYNKETNAWDKMNGADIIGLRKAVRIARGESAPGVVRGPIRLTEASN